MVKSKKKESSFKEYKKILGKDSSFKLKRGIQQNPYKIDVYRERKTEGRCMRL